MPALLGHHLSKSRGALLSGTLPGMNRALGFLQRFVTHAIFFLLAMLVALGSRAALGQSQTLILGNDTSVDGGLVRRVSVDSQGRLLSGASTVVTPSDGGYTTGTSITMPQPYQCGTAVQSVYVMDGGSVSVLSSSTARTYSVVCNSKDNSSGNVRCRADGLAASTTVGSAGTVLGVGDCVMYTNPASVPVYCAGSGLYVSTFECGATPSAAVTPAVALDAGAAMYFALESIGGTGAQTINSVTSSFVGSTQNSTLTTGIIGNGFDTRSCVSLRGLVSTSGSFPATITPGSPWSFSGWFKPVSYASACFGNTGVGLMVATNQGVYLNADGTVSVCNNTGTCQTSTAALALNTWSNVTTSYDGANVRIYINSVLRGGGSITFANMTPDTYGTHSNYYQFNGYMDELGVWLKAVNPGEVSYLYNNGAGRTWPL